MFNWFKKQKTKNSTLSKLPPYNEHELKDLLLNRFKYQAIPELLGKTVHIRSFESLEEDLLSAFTPDYPYVKCLWYKDKNWIEGTDLVFFWKEPMFQINLLVDDTFDITSGVSEDHLLELDFVEKLDSDFRIVTKGDMEELGWQIFQKCLNEEFSRLYLHLFLRHSKDLSKCWDNSQYPPNIYEGHEEFFDLKNTKNRMALSKSLCKSISKHFFPRNMYVIDACITNVPSSLVWSNRYFYW